MTYSRNEKSEMTAKIVTYLERRPDSQDTLEGIMRWWLLEMEIEYQTALVKEVLNELVEMGLLIESKSKASSLTYRLNSKKTRSHK
jgi:hypothetical protein